MSARVKPMLAAAGAWAIIVSVACFWLLLWNGCDQPPQSAASKALSQSSSYGKALLLTDHLGNKYAAFWYMNQYWELRPLMEPAPTNSPDMTINVEVNK